MRTTLDLPADLLRQLKAQAALEGTTDELVVPLVERSLTAPSETPPGSTRNAVPTLALNNALLANDFSNPDLFGVLGD